MKRFFVITFFIFGFLTASAQISAQVKKDSELDNKQKAFLASRAEGSPIRGTFNSLGSLLFALHDVVIHTDFKEVGAIKLGSPFPSGYKPTWKEIFDSIALQTQTVWSYDQKRKYWLFTPAEISPPFSINIAAGWTSQNQGIYIGYKPPTFPVGMDIYQLGTYSADDPKDEAKLFEETRNTLALRFATGFNKEITVNEMKTVKVDGADALFFEAVSPIRKEVMWRQWVFVKNGKAFAIVSSLNKDDTKLYEDVQAMVKSFQTK